MHNESVGSWNTVFFSLAVSWAFLRWLVSSCYQQCWSWCQHHTEFFDHYVWCNHVSPTGTEEPTNFISALCWWCCHVGVFGPWLSVCTGVVCSRLWSSWDESASPGSRSWFSIGKRWSALSSLGRASWVERKMEREVDRRIGAAEAVMQSLYWSMKKELGQMVKVSIHWSIYVPAFTCGHELWAMTKRTSCRNGCHPQGGGTLP